MYYIPQHPGAGEEGLKFVLDMVSKFNPIYRFYYGVFIPVVSCFHPSTLKVAIQGTNAKPRGAFALYEFVVPWLGTLYYTGGSCVCDFVQNHQQRHLHFNKTLHCFIHVLPPTPPPPPNKKGGGI